MRYAVYLPRTTLAGAVEHYTDGRRFSKLNEAVDSVPRDALDVGAVYVFDTLEGAGYYRWFKVKAFHQLAGAEIQSVDASPFPYPASPRAYFVCRDSAMTVRGRAGMSWTVMLGDPWNAVGVRQDEFDTLAEAVEYMRHHSGDSPMFRVRLERIDGEHSVKEIK